MVQEKYKHNIYPNLSKGHAPPPGQLTEQRTHVFTAVTMAGLQQGGYYQHDQHDDDKLIPLLINKGHHDQNFRPMQNSGKSAGNEVKIWTPTATLYIHSQFSSR